MYLIHSIDIAPVLDAFVAAMETYWRRLREEPDDYTGNAAAEVTAKGAYTSLFTVTAEQLADHPNNPFLVELTRYLAPPSLPDLRGLATLRAIFAAQCLNAISPV